MHAWPLSYRCNYENRNLQNKKACCMIYMELSMKFYNMIMWFYYFHTIASIVTIWNACIKINVVLFWNTTLIDQSDGPQGPAFFFFFFIFFFILTTIRTSECLNSALLLAGHYNWTKVFHNFVDVGGSRKIALTSVFAKFVKLGVGWHALFCCVLLVFACSASCSASYPGVKFLPQRLQFAAAVPRKYSLRHHEG